MSLLAIVLLSAALLAVAYRLYGGLLVRLLKLDPRRATPADALRDGRDFVPIDQKFLLGQHFSAIAAAGPIVGPILAGASFGWAPTLVWILLGAILVGGVHDFTALVASLRHRARTIAEVVREHMTRRSYALFLLFIWVALVYIIVAFTDITSSSFLGQVELENGQRVAGGAIATSSLLYLALPVAMGLLLRFTRLPLGIATVLFLPLVGAAIWVGQYRPLDLALLLKLDPARAQKVWNVLLLGYCYVASIVPMWLLLQPRGHLGGLFLYASMLAAGLGVVLGGNTIAYPAFTGWTSAAGQPLFPFLFITVACGACSGFHALVASGTSSKQVRRETDAKLIGYGAMLLEALVAVISLACVMMLTADSPLVRDLRPNALYASGIGSFLAVLGIPPALGVSFGLMAFTTFVYDTLDVCTRLGRYVVQELTGWSGRGGRWFATAATAGLPLYFLLTEQVSPQTGASVPAWRTFWGLFGASNQLLAALTLVGITVWLWRTRRARWVWFVTGLPAVFMYTISVWELARLVIAGFRDGWTAAPVPWLSVLLIVLAALMLVEAGKVIFAPARPPSPTAPAPMTA